MKVKFFFAFFYSGNDEPGNVIPEEIKLLSYSFGGIDLVSEQYQFKKEYYQMEMGENISKFFFSLKKLASPMEILNFKKYSMEIEDKYRINGRRRINIDPGYITLGGVILSSRKYAGHRVFISEDVLGDLQLIYFKGRWESLPWTYEDYKSYIAQKFFKELREIYKKQIKGL